MAIQKTIFNSSENLKILYSMQLKLNKRLVFSIFFSSFVHSKSTPVNDRNDPEYFLKDPKPKLIYKPIVLWHGMGDAGTSPEMTRLKFF